VTCRFLPLIVVVLSTSVVAQDDIRAKLDTAKKQIEEDAQQSRQAVTDRFATVIRELATTGKIDPSIEMQKYQKAFAADGRMTTCAEMTDAYADHVRKIREGRSKLQAAYDEAIKQYGVAVKIDQAAELKAEKEKVSPTVQFVSLQHGSRKNSCLIHHRDSVVVDNVANLTRLDATYELVPGLSDKTCVSFRSVNYPNQYLAHGDFRLSLTPYKDTDEFRKNASFKQIEVTRTTVMLQSINFPDRFVRVREDKSVWIDPREATRAFLNQSSFTIAEPQFK
jgi:Alpha-L-arabinofuranosidase B (ABFB) domain